MIELVAYRLAALDTPLWVNPSRSGARYNRALAGPTQYLSLHPLTPWAEYLRANGLRDPDDVAELRLRLWAARILADDMGVLDFETAPKVGLDPEDLIRDDHGPCRDFGERVRSERALPSVWRVPSAALPGTENVVVFGPRVLTGYSERPVDTEVDVPGAVAADRAGTLRTLPAIVRYPGMPHGAFEAWRSGRAFVFEEPVAPVG